MTTLSTNLQNNSARRGIAARILSGIAAVFDAHALAASRRDRIEALNRLSDAELAEMGIPRDQIAHHVFKDL